MSPELQEAVEQVGLHLASRDWRGRSDALSALSALLPALPEVPNGPLEELLNGVVARLSDCNAKVNEQALQVTIDSNNSSTCCTLHNLMPSYTCLSCSLTAWS